MYTAFLHTDTDAKTAAEVESANAAFILRCYRCLQVGHIGKDCPHGEAIDRVISQRVSPNNGFNNGGKGPHKPQGSTLGNTSANAASSSTSAAPSRTNRWLVDSGATSPITNDRVAFTTLQLDRRAIRMANAMVIQSKIL